MVTLENSYVFIKSMLPVKNQGPDVSLVLDIDFEDTKAEDGSRRIVLSTNDQALSEQWFIDNQTNTIRNRQKNLCISYSGISNLAIRSGHFYSASSKSRVYTQKRYRQL